jgi:transmembrane sensor
MSPRYEDELRIAERAAEWHGVLSRRDIDGLGEKDSAEFMAWLEESPKHVREFLLQHAWDVETRGIDARREILVEEIIQKLPANVVALEHESGRDSPKPPYSSSRPANRRLGRRSRWAAGVAAALAVIAVASWQLHSKRTFSTAIGESRTVELEDGSKIELNTASQVRIAFTDELRDVQLLRGEALFKVRHDARRPFRVLAGPSVIQAVGTEFNVNRRPLGILVAVIEGKVRVYTRSADGSRLAPLPRTARREILVAGEQARLSERGQIHEREQIEETNALAWRQRRLVFRDDALADIAAEFNRYNSTLQIAVEGAAQRKRYGGIFDADDPESIVRFVAHDEDLVVRKEEGRIIIRAQK